MSKNIKSKQYIMINIKNLIYATACLSFSVIIGAGIYETVAIWPRAFAAPPASLTMFQGQYSVNALAFWSKIHPVTLLLLITSLVLFWKSERRKNVLITLVGYIVVIVSTFLYFVPELIEITNTEYSTAIEESLKSRGALWQKLNMIRMIFIIGLAILLYLGLTKPVLKQE